MRTIHCDVLVVGAGITGALIGDQLTREGMKVCVIDRREAGWGSTSASTGLLQYEIDTELQELTAHYGIADAVLAYRACKSAVVRLRALAKALGGIDFQPMQSLYYASHWYHQRRLRQEAALRKAHGFELETLERSALLEKFGIKAPVAILTPLAAQTDPYQFAHRLLGHIEAGGGRVHARTALTGFKRIRDGLQVQTDRDLSVRCKHLIFASGYECQTWLHQRLASNRSSYVFISEPMPDALGPLKKTLIWESSRPYLYLRCTVDHRLVVGGEDDALDIAVRRDARVMVKAQALLKRANRLFPHLPLRIAFAWAGTFAETNDGLPYFGTHEQYGPRVHFAMAYGGNGIVYSLVGARLLRDALQGRRNPCAELFSFKRLKRR